MKPNVCYCRITNPLFKKSIYGNVFHIVHKDFFEATTYEIITTKFEILYHNFVIVPCSSQYNAIVQT